MGESRTIPLEIVLLPPENHPGEVVVVEGVLQVIRPLCCKHLSPSPPGCSVSRWRAARLKVAVQVPTGVANSAADDLRRRDPTPPPLVAELVRAQTQERGRLYLRVGNLVAALGAELLQRRDDFLDHLTDEWPQQFGRQVEP
jgi:hypothetical protein